MKLQLFICFISLVLTSCAITGKKYHYTGTKHDNKGAIRVVEVVKIQHNNSGIIYGNVQTNSRLKSIVINKLLLNGKIDKKTTIIVRTFANGNFVAENLKPGNYIISSLETTNNSLDLFVVTPDMEFFSIKVHVAEAKYAGTFKIVDSKIKIDRLVLVRSAIPTEKKILKHVSFLERDTVWEKMLLARMRKLI
ncbi:hypothetical protein MNBD_GAMMA22-34 [hydrothermal vent metagenome]|uniref:Uncharacterized protein n=1 Tax=hydrothermal vent metagenome TaxID=652676 RepID=A0A3B0ZPD0_9ZZZZ